MSQTHRISKNNTTVANLDGKTIVTLHQTQIVILNHAARTATLNSGGFRTATTRTRMTQVFNEMRLGIGVFQRAGKWFVSLIDGREIPFFDGMTVPVL